MPNHITNIITAPKHVIDALRGDEEQPVDFNKIIPMPAILNGITEDSYTPLAKFLAGALEPGADSGISAAIRSLEVDAAGHRLKESLPKNADINQFVIDYTMSLLVGPDHGVAFLRKMLLDEGRMSEKSFEMLTRTMEAYDTCGAFTWFDWSIANWGTKWNAYDAVFGDSGESVTFNTAWSTPMPVLQKLSEMYPDDDISVMYADEDIGSNQGHLKLHAGDVTERPIEDPIAFAFDVIGGDPEAFGYVKDPETGKYVYAGEEEEADAQ